MAEPWDDVSAAGNWLAELERAFRPDLIHLNDYPHGVGPWSVPVLMVGHSCVLSWHAAVRGRPADAGWDRYRSTVTAGLRGADLVVAPTQAMLAELARFYGPLPPQQVIANGRSPADYAPAPKEKFVFAAGRIWDEAKNLGSLARAAPELNWPVFLAGEVRPPEGTISANECLAAVHPLAPGPFHAGERAERCSRESNGGGLPSVHYLGRLPSHDMAGWYARAAIYVFPARYEPFGLSVLEAALSGCALVLGDIASLREIWGEAAVFVRPENTPGLIEAVNRLAADPLLRAEFARRAWQRAQQLTSERMAAAYFAAYRELIERRGVAGERGKVVQTCDS
jgi:glycosyltransferase involved in cell wall biosynthesis